MVLCWSKPIPGQEQGTSPIVEAIITESAFSNKQGNPMLICDRLPSVDELKLMYLTDLREIHFFGELNDPDAVSWLNTFNKSVSQEDAFKVVGLSIDA